MYGQAKRSLVEFSGPKKRLKDITPGDADDWLQSMIGAGLALNTYRKRCSMAKLFFKAAIRKRLIEENPFRDLKGSLRPNPERLRYISAENIRDVMAMAPDAEWRVIIALAHRRAFRASSGRKGAAKSAAAGVGNGRKAAEPRKRKTPEPLEFQRLPILTAQWCDRRYTSLGSNDLPEDVVAETGYGKRERRALQLPGCGPLDGAGDGLEWLCQIWPTLPEDVRSRILRLANREKASCTED